MYLDIAQTLASLTNQKTLTLLFTLHGTVLQSVFLNVDVVFLHWGYLKFIIIVTCKLILNQSWCSLFKLQTGFKFRSVLVTRQSRSLTHMSVQEMYCSWKLLVKQSVVCLFPVLLFHQRGNNVSCFDNITIASVKPYVKQAMFFILVLDALLPRYTALVFMFTSNVQLLCSDNYILHCLTTD